MTRLGYQMMETANSVRSNFIESGRYEEASDARAVDSMLNNLIHGNSDVELVTLFLERVTNHPLSNNVSFQETVEATLEKVK